jgi:hypothetical protein
MDQKDLVKAIRNYRALDDKLKELNTEVYKLREERKFVESEMSDILRRSTFATLSKLEIQDDGSYIKIQRPDTWNKPWSLSVRDLGAYLSEYFSTTSTPNAEKCVDFIVQKKKKDLVAKEFSFTRVIGLEDKNGGRDC